MQPPTATTVNVVDKKDADLKKFFGGYIISKIEEFSDDGRGWVLNKTYTEPALLYYDGNAVFFKRGNKEWLMRNLIYNKYLPEEHFYTYTGTWGITFIKDNFSEIIFYEQNDSGKFIKRYVYKIGRYDVVIKPF